MVDYFVEASLQTQQWWCSDKLKETMAASLIDAWPQAMQNLSMEKEKWRQSPRQGLFTTDSSKISSMKSHYIYQTHSKTSPCSVVVCYHKLDSMCVCALVAVLFCFKKENFNLDWVGGVVRRNWGRGKNIIKIYEQLWNVINHNNIWLWHNHNLGFYNLF